jgi:riboflavin biosynthesis pyrimidine reductase
MISDSSSIEGIGAASIFIGGATEVEETVLQLYPLPAGEVPLKNLYLGHRLRERSQRAGRPFVYGNFIASLDGRIAIPPPTGAGLMVPEQIANPRDWRLFQELAAHADILIASGRYLREYAKGPVQEILDVADDARFRDLADWRSAQGLPPQPDIAVISRSLDFGLPKGLIEASRRVVVVTASSADAKRRKALEAQGGVVVVAGEAQVEGRQMVERLAGMGYRTVYSAAGSEVMHMLLNAGVLDRLYLTIAGRILGGEPYAGIVQGAPLDPPIDLELASLYYDLDALEGVGQLLAAYDRAGPPRRQGA